MVLSVLFLGMGGVALAQGPAAGNGTGTETVNCTLLVPPNPLTAAGLAAPYRLLPPCHERDPGTAAFVQATIIDPASGQVSVYDPLVIDEDSTPAVPPVRPRLPSGAVVGIWFGFNGDNLALRASAGSLRSGHCVNGLAGGVFGQFAYCNAPAFFAMAGTAVAAGWLHVPAPGTGRDNRPCPTVRDFGLVDMDPSDNVTSSYLSLPDGRIAQNTTANAAALSTQGAKIEINGSDNALLDAFVDPALGCTPFTAPDLAEPGRMATSLALNELQARAYQTAPVALVPLNDPMTQAGGAPSVDKTNLYRAGVGQPPVDAASDTPLAYCRNLVGVGIDRTRLDRTLTRHMVSPDMAAANSLFTFLAQRLSASFTGLGCGDLLRMRDPVRLVTLGGVVVDARFARTTPPPAAARVSPPAAPSARPPAPASPAESPPLPGAAPASALPAADGVFTAAPVIRPAAPADASGDSGSPDASGAPAAAPAGTSAPTPTSAATPLAVEPVRVRVPSATGLPLMRDGMLPQLAGGVLVAIGSILLIASVVAMKGRRHRYIRV